MFAYEITLFSILGTLYVLINISFTVILAARANPDKFHAFLKWFKCCRRTPAPPSPVSPERQTIASPSEARVSKIIEDEYSQSKTASSRNSAVAPDLTVNDMPSSLALSAPEAVGMNKSTSLQKHHNQHVYKQQADVTSRLLPTPPTAPLIIELKNQRLRPHPMLATRGPSMVILMNCVSVIIITLYVASKIGGSSAVPCELERLESFLFNVVPGVIYVARCIMLYVRFEITNEKMGGMEASLMNSLSRSKSGTVGGGAPQSPDPALDAIKKAAAIDETKEVLSDDDTSGELSGGAKVTRAASGGRKRRNSSDWKNGLKRFDTSKSTSPRVSGRRDAVVMTTTLYYTIRRHYFENNRLMIGSAISIIILCIPAIFLSAFEPAHRATDGTCVFAWTGEYILMAYRVIIAVFIVICGLKLRKQFDFFFIRDELKFTLVSITVLVVLFFPFNFNANLQAWESEHFHFSTLLCLLMYFDILLFSTVIPVFLSFDGVVDEPKLADLENTFYGENDAPLDTLTGTLQYAEGFEAFCKFLEGEFSIENLRFYCDVNNYKSDLAELLTESDWKGVAAENAIIIYDVYIASSAPLMVNLRFAISGQIQNFIDRIKMNPESATFQEYLTAFDLAQKETFFLMETDSFRRFKVTELFKQVRHQESEKRKLLTAFREAHVM
jgi:hypothetical protein